jgi:hypothetical protein
VSSIREEDNGCLFTIVSLELKTLPGALLGFKIYLPNNQMNEWMNGCLNQGGDEKSGRFPIRSEGHIETAQGVLHKKGRTLAWCWTLPNLP